MIEGRSSVDLAKIREAVRSTTSVGTTRHGEANQILLKLLAKDPSLKEKTIEHWAAAVRDETGKSCSISTVNKTKCWEAAMRDSGRRRASKKSRTGRKDELLEVLVADEEEANARKAIEESGLSAKQTEALLHDLVTGIRTPANTMQILMELLRPSTSRKKRS